MNNGTSPELWSHQLLKQTSSNDSVHKMSANGHKCAAANHDSLSVIDIDMDSDHADDREITMIKHSHSHCFLAGCQDELLGEAATDKDDESPAKDATNSHTGSCPQQEVHWKAQPRPSPSPQSGPGLMFDQAQARALQAQARAFRPGQAWHITTPRLLQSPKPGGDSISSN
ncbi:hypothetical protein BDN67DRAFT_981349 [Paxillus ammoniavirescens]|nr:hypothetical protein BDN67DRAFT_981349 [Paxillus ammoniavirescens]